MKTLTNWTARRAGGRITIKATDAETKQLTKVVGVDTIERSQPAGQVIATDKSGERYVLA